jgi:large subunit ribosomal protein L32
LLGESNALNGAVGAEFITAGELMLPVTKKSKMRKRTRRSHLALRPVALIACAQCGRAKLPHAACGNCGYVNAHTTIKVGGEES